VVFAIDTSGSIDNDMLQEFLAEAQLALEDLNPEKLTVLQCDTQINAVNVYEPGDKIDLKVYGRGGTDFRPVFQWCKEQDEEPRVLVYLTDLDGSFPEEAPEFPVIWVSDRKADVPFGDVVVTK
jgi:predicted metal-dependent peptidase